MGKEFDITMYKHVRIQLRSGALDSNSSLLKSTLY